MAKGQIESIKQRRKFLKLDVSYIPLIIGAAVTTGIVFLVYQQTREILKERLRERLTSITSTAVLSINPNTIERLIQIEKRDPDAALTSPELATVVSYLRRVRDANENIRYIYLWNRSETPGFVHFTADAEMIDPIDSDGNGVIEDTEIPPAPGEEYDASEIENLDKGFEAPIAQNNFIIDKWGTFMTAFAPIKNQKGDTLAVLGIDVEVTDFKLLISATLIPFSILAGLLLLMLTVQTVALVRIWGNRVEMVKELDKQKDELLSIVSHQLTTPVSSVKWYLEMMLDGDYGQLNKELDTQVRLMQEAIANFSDLVSMILDVSRIQLGRMKVDRSDLDLSQFFKEVVNGVKPKAEVLKVKLITNIPEKLMIAKLDKRLMRMTLENLLTNAIKYSKEGNGIAELSVNLSGELLSYSVKDNGCGIPQDEQAKIFGKLFRASNVSKINGNGFGLFAAKGAIEAQGGSIRFESEVNKGTTFFVTVPVK